MKFRSSILSLAAVSALTATAFMVTGCGSSSSSSGTASGGTTPSTGTSTGVMVKGMWAGIPYNRTLNGTTTTADYTTAASGQYMFAKGDNVTFKPGMGIAAQFTNLNASGTMANNATKIMQNADAFTQGGTALNAAAAKAASQVLATIYQQAGISENTTTLTTAQQENLAKAIAATNSAYAAEPGKFSLATTTLANSFSTVYNDLLVNYMGPNGVTAANGSAITSAVATGMVAGYATNLTNVQTEQQKIIDKASAAATLVNAPAPADLAGGYVIATHSNNSLADTLSFGKAAKSYFVNGTILQNSSDGSGSSLAFLDGDYVENASVNNGTDTLVYMATLHPFDITTNVSTGALWNLTVGGDVYQFKANTSDQTVGSYNVSSKYGFYNISAAQNKLVLNLYNASSTADYKANALADFGANDAANSSLNKNMTIAFKTPVDPNGRTFVTYYWNKIVKVFDDWSEGTVVGTTLATDSANATFDGATIDKESVFTK